MGMGCLECAQQWFSVPAGAVFSDQVIENQLFLTDTRAGKSVIKVCSRSIAAALVLAGACFGVSADAAGAKDKFVALGTGSPNGTYAPVGSGICDLVNEGRASTGVRCIAYNTGGSVYNIQAITSGELEMGITRSDLAYQSYEGIDSFKAIGPNRDIRAITTLYAMPIAVVVKNDAGIEKFADMVGKRINIGNKGSGKRSVADLILGQMGWQRGDFSAVLELTTTQMGKAFCDGNVDILIEGLGNPSQFYEKMVGECGGKFLAVPDDVVAKIRKNFPYFAALDIPGGIYSNTPSPVGTFGFKATLVTKASLSDATAYDVTAAVFDAFEKFQEKHASLKLADPISMVNNGIFIPIHPGAERYLRERGLLKPPAPAKTAAVTAGDDKSAPKKKETPAEADKEEDKSEPVEIKAAPKKPAEPKQAAPKQTEPKQTEPTQAEPKQTEPTEMKTATQQPAEPMQGKPAEMQAVPVTPVEQNQIEQKPSEPSAPATKGASQ